MSKIDEAYQYIKERILSGTYAPLEAISDEALQKELQMSRTPIRNALLQLERERFVNIYPQKGTVVSQVSMEDIRMVYEARSLVEPHLVQQLSESLSPAYRNELETIREGFLNPPQENEERIRSFHIQLDNRLHEIFIENSTNLFLKSMMDNVLEFDRFMRVPTSFRNPNYSANVSEHVAVIDAILAGDGALAKEKLEYHIVNSRESTMRYVFYMGE